jgi:hypothetical protein
MSETTATATATEDLRRVESEIAALNAEWKRLDRPDPLARRRQNEIGHLLADLETRRERAVALVATAAERDEIIAALRVHHDRVVERDVPTPEEVAALYRLGHETERLRLVLHRATNDRQFARGADPIDALRSHWHDQQRQRDQLLDLDRLRAGRPGFRQIAPAWMALADKLAAVQSKEGGLR